MCLAYAPEKISVCHVVRAPHWASVIGTAPHHIYQSLLLLPWPGVPCPLTVSWNSQAVDLWDTKTALFPSDLTVRASLQIPFPSDDWNPANGTALWTKDGKSSFPCFSFWTIGPSQDFSFIILLQILVGRNYYFKRAQTPPAAVSFSPLNKRETLRLEVSCF